ncbi:MAG TPA: winged helix-turn-helix domain-containing protein [Fimbriimonadaceae bacterium]|nr:winged helix-turn-helix domain-containing protein [Fimbriimonadaceae bacterium]
MSHIDAPWTFLSNHSHVLICLQRDPYALMREVASQVGITERAVQRIVADLERGGFLKRHRDGRRNRYSIHVTAHLRHEVEAHRTVGEMLELMA